MFFMIGVTEGQKNLDYRQPAECGACGRYGAYEVFMTFTQLLLFFIPVFKWNRQYFVKMSCCDTVYTLDPAVGAAIERGEQVTIRPADLVRIQWTGNAGNSYSSTAESEGRVHHRCVICGYETDEDFDFCPKCGQRF